MATTDAENQIVHRSVLHDAQKEMNASFAIFHGWEMAEAFSDSIEEHKTVRTSGGVIDLSHFGAIRVSGGEAVQFLNGLVTNNVKTLEAGKGMRAAMLTGHGKVKAICRIFNLGDSYLVTNYPQTHDKVFKYLFPFSYAGDFKAEEVSDGFRTISVQGPNSPLLMKEVCFERLPAMAEYDWVRTLIAGQMALVIKASRTGEIGFDILVSSNALKDVWDFLLLKGAFHSIVPVGLRALDSLRIEAGVPEYGQDVDEANMMLEVGLEDAVSFTKGCYTGQEAVAMATYRGHVSKKLSGLLVSGDLVPSRGDPVMKDDREIGIVTSALRSPSLGATVALAYLKHGFSEPNSAVQLHINDKIVPAVIAKLPFYPKAY